jgi:Ca2+-binding RTX toxin-like protein
MKKAVPGFSVKTIASLAAASVVLALLSALAAGAPEPIGPDFRISEAGTDANPNRDALNPAIAHNLRDDNYLVVWQADDLPTDEEFEIFGQLVSANGTKLGSELRISSVRTDGDATRGAFEPAIAYNPTANEYLVSWQADDLSANEEFEIFGQRLSATGAEVGADDFRISSAGVDGDVNRAASNPTIAYNPTANEYLVSWEADGLPTDDEDEIFGQRLSATGAEVGADDFRISSVGTDGNASRDALQPAVAYNPTANEYLVSWAADDLATNEEFEIFGQRLSAAGAEVGADDFRISEAGTDGDEARDASDPTTAYNPTANEYLVSWEADGLPTDDEDEIFGQRLSAAGAEVGADDFRISSAGTDGDSERNAREPVIAYNSKANEYLVSWDADDLSTDNEFEIFAQRLSATGAEIGADDFRISTVGTDGDAERDASEPTIAYNSAANEYLVSWQADGLPAEGEFEIFGQRLAEPKVSPPAGGKCADKRATRTGTAGPDRINGTSKRDVIAALGGNDIVRSLGGNDLICGGRGNDKLFGARGRDALRGEDGADTLLGGPEKDKLTGGRGRDTLKGGPGKDTLAGGPGRDREDRRARV